MYNELQLARYAIQLMLTRTGNCKVSLVSRHYEQGGFSTILVDTMDVEMGEILSKVIRKRRLQIQGTVLYMYMYMYTLTCHSGYSTGFGYFSCMYMYTVH